MKKLALIFTGHMIDTPDRAKPRFPAHMETAVVEAIYSYVRQIRDEFEGDLVGISSGACGGDIIFIETCQNLGIENYLFLPFSHEEFLKSSVNVTLAGDWEQRFLFIWEGLGEKHRVVLEADQTSNVYDACNRRMLNFGMGLSKQVSLLALWDGTVPERPGGTADFVRQVKELKLQVHQIAIDQLMVQN